MPKGTILIVDDIEMNRLILHFSSSQVDVSHFP